MARRLGVLPAAWEICKKDVRIERRTGEIVFTAGVFAIMVGFLASMAFQIRDLKANASVASGTIWITTFFAATLSFGRVWQRERDESALTGLLVSPIPRASIFLGKALATFGMIALVEIPLVALCLFLFQIDVSEAGILAGILLLGTLGLALLGTLFGAMTVRTRARDLVLSIVLFPLLSPVLVCAVVATRKVFEAQPFDDYAGFVGLLGLFDFVALMGGIGLFGALVDD